MRDEEKGTKIPHQIFVDEEQGFKKAHQEFTTTLGADPDCRSQIKIWL
jgi:hypothetical protein